MHFRVLSPNTAYIVAFNFCDLMYGNISNILKWLYTYKQGEVGENIIPVWTSYSKIL